MLYFPSWNSIPHTPLSSISVPSAAHMGLTWDVYATQQGRT